MAVALYATSALPMMEGDGCEVSKVEELFGIKDEKVLGLTDEVIIAGEVTPAVWEEISIDVTMFVGKPDEIFCCDRDVLLWDDSEVVV